MLRPILSVLLLSLSFFVSSAHAVLTRNCPSQLEIDFHRFDYFSEAQIRSLPAHAKYTEKMFQSAARSKEHLVAKTGSAMPAGKFVLNYRKNGKCIYTAPLALFSVNKITLYTQGGTDWIRHEFTYHQRARDSEAFAVQAVLSSYSVDGIAIDDRSAKALYTTVEYGCYDRTCLTDAQIGVAEFREPELFVAPTN